MAAPGTLPHSHVIRKSGVVVLNGYGIRVQVNAGHLLLHDGIADERRTIRLPRVNHGLKRLVMIGSDGFITLEALRWLAEQDASFLMLDRTGKVLTVTGPVAPSDAKLRRAQALAVSNGTALKISKELISQKLAGQESLVRDMLHDSPTADAIGRFRATLASAENVERVTVTEAQAAKLYWHAWADLPILWPRRDEMRIPEHWKRFGSRISPLTHSPRLAASPPNALLNLLYGILESEARLSAVAMGMDPAIGLLHVDTSHRDSLACDLMEVCRPGGVDAFVLNWLRSEPLRRSDFWEDRSGNCRIASPLAIKLCETADTWRRLLAPVAEYVAQEIWSSALKATSKSRLARQLIATRLTRRNKREVKGSEVPTGTRLKPDHVCSGCGVTIRADRQRCLKCSKQVTSANFRDGRKSAQQQEYLEKRADTMRRHKQAIQSWKPSDLPKWLTRDVYLKQIQPVLANVAKAQIRSTLAVSEPYSSDIQAGRRVPHPRHWRVLAELVGVEGRSLATVS
jgi:CRISPR-associated endonuclease Cas1